MRPTRTAPVYRLYALAGTWPREPGAVKGFLCEAHAAAGADDISRYGGWRAYVAGRERRDG